MQLNTNDYYTVNEAAALKEVTRRAIYYWVSKGLLPKPVQCLGRSLMPKTVIDNFKAPWKDRGKKTGKKPHDPR